MKNLVGMFMLLVCASVWGQTNAPSDVGSTNQIGPLADTNSIENIEEAVTVAEFYNKRANTESRSNLFSKFLLEMGSASFSNSLNQAGERLMVQNGYLSKTNLGPVVLTNSEGVLITNAFIFRTSFDYALYRISIGGGRINLKSTCRLICENSLGMIRKSQSRSNFWSLEKS